VVTSQRADDRLGADELIPEGTHVVVRVGESSPYAGVIADNEPDVDLAVEVVGRLRT
jgi:hypothetical protein